MQDSAKQTSEIPLEDMRKENHRRRLLNRVVAWYHQTFMEDARGMDYLAERGLTDLGLFGDFKVGFSNGTLLTTIPEESELQETLKELGVLDGQGREIFYGCVVFPWFDENADCQGMYGLRVLKGETQGLYLPGERAGVFNWQAVKRSRSVILTDSILEALLLHQAGFASVVPLWGNEGLSEDHKKFFFRYGTKETYVVFEAGAAVLHELEQEGLQAFSVKLPPLPADPQVIEKLLRNANPKTDLQPETVKRREGWGYVKTDTGFSIQHGSRRYEAKGVSKEGLKLRVTLKAYRKGDEKRFHLDSVDLYSSRGRILFAKGCAAYLGEKEEVVQHDLSQLIELAEEFEPAESQKAPIPTMTQEEQEEALDFLKDPRMMEIILEDFEAVGYMGEEANKLMGYLAAVSRKLEEPVSILIQSRSAAGKSTLQDAILQFVPKEEYEKYTRLTGQALFYKDETGLCHKLLAIEEEAGAKDASYSIRNLQSAKMLSIATTGKDPATGKLRTSEYQVKGPVALMLTTTSVDMDYETQNRFITLTIDESKEMTERILKSQRAQETLEGLKGRQANEPIIRRHQNAQRLLRPLSVVNPFAFKLTFPSGLLRARRDQKKYLGIIKAIAFLHQYQREIKAFTQEGGEVVSYVEVTALDIQKANHLAREVLGRTLDELSAPSRSLLKIIREMVKKRGEGEEQKPRSFQFTRRDIREFSGWSDFQVKTHIKQLEELEYLYSATGKKGKEYVYELLALEGGEDGAPFMPGLSDVK